MTRIFTLTFFLLFVFYSNSQNLDRFQPKSWNISTLKKVAPIVLEKPDLKTFRDEDKINDKDKSIPWRFGYDHYVNFGLNNSGKWHTLANGDRIWRVNIVSPDALSMNLIFNQFYLPKGGEVHVYNNDRSEILNAYTHEHNNPDEILGTWMVSGESIWVEYFEPEYAKNKGRLQIGNVIHGYRTLNVDTGNNAKTLNSSGPCNVDVNCDINATSSLAHSIKEDVKKSVGMVVVGGNGVCSGALINNTNNDGTPYFLTANHCLGGFLSGWAFRFNWASDASVADCATNAPSVDNGFIQTASGAVLRAASSQSDMALLEITDTAFFNSNPDVVWAGWNRSTVNLPSLNVGIHHPRGDIQKVCVDLQGATRQTTLFNGNPTTQVWRVEDWDLGVTEPGSSGSPLFDQNGLIIGKLSGGAAACLGTNDNGRFDVYGRFGVAWDFSSDSSEQLQFWLDPAGNNPIIYEQFPPAQLSNLDASISITNLSNEICDNSINPIITVKNLGNTPLTSATITYQYDGQPQGTINWTGNLASLEFDDVNLSSIPISGVGLKSFTASISNPNGGADENTANDNSGKVFNIPNSFTTSELEIIITPDRYGGETTWDLKTSDGNVVASGGPYTTIGTNGTQPDEVTNVTINAFDQCYIFTINDSFGDGICCDFGNGSYRIEDGDGNILINGDGNFNFSATDSLKLTNPLSTSDHILSENITIYPNPSLSDFIVDISVFSDLVYDVFDITGKLIKKGTFENGENHLIMNQEASGLYFVKITDPGTNYSTSRKIVKQ